MNPSAQTADVISPKISRTGVRLWQWVVAVVGLLGLGILVWRSRPAPAELPNELASNLTRRDGRLFSPGSTVAFTGWMLERYPDSGLMSRSLISNGILQGVSEGWFTNGVRQVQEHFVDGVSEGAIIKWYPNGSKFSEGIARAGKLEGIFRRWHGNGQLSEEVTLREGLPDGVSRAWFPSGSLKAEVTLNSGKVVSQKFFKEGELPTDASLAKAGGDR